MAGIGTSATRSPLTIPWLDQALAAGNSTAPQPPGLPAPTPSPVPARGASGGVFDRAGVMPSPVGETSPAMPDIAPPQPVGDVSAPLPTITEPRGIFDRIGDVLRQPGMSGALLRSAGATLQGGLGAGIAAGANYMDNRRAQDIQQQHWQGQLGVQQQGLLLRALQANQQQQEKAQETLAKVAAGLRQLPADQRHAALQSYLPGLSAVGIGADQLANFDLTDGGLDARMNFGQSVPNIVSAGQPHYVPIPPGGRLVDVHNPSAVAQYGEPQPATTPAPTAGLPHVSSDADVARLPPGAQFITPDGKVRTKGGSGSSGPNPFP